MTFNVENGYGPVNLLKTCTCASGCIDNSSFSCMGIQQYTNAYFSALYYVLSYYCPPHRKFEHPNIVKILGICVDNDPVFIIMELMPAGDLLKFLREARPESVSFFLL